MGLDFIGYLFVFSLILRPLVCQQPNTDGFYVFEFLRKMGSEFESSSLNNLTSVCSLKGVVCDGNGEHVRELVFSGLGLSGSIPDNTIAKLNQLSSLDLSNNKITAFSSDFWSLSSLKTLNLSMNSIYGYLPNNIGNFGFLGTLDLSRNRFSGDIPEAIGSLGSLKILKLNDNEFENSIPPRILGCSLLVVMDLSSNKLDGALPDDFVAAFPELESLNLAGNGIHGRDTDFQQMKAIKRLNVSGNSFQGLVAGVFQELMEVVDLSRNQFEGHVSRVQLNWSRLVSLDLSENQLSGEIFRNLNKAMNLKYLNLAFNRFSRQQFPRIGMLSGLEYLNLSKSSLTGSIPSEIGKMSSLWSLDLSQNHLSGHIPVFDVTRLHVLDVSQNNLSGEIPGSLLEKLPRMECYDFSFNNLSFCGSKFDAIVIQKYFHGLLNSCPLAADPVHLRRRESIHKGLKLALALTLAMIFLLVGLLFLAFNCRRKSRTWAVKQALYKEERSISGPFSFQIDSTTWVADVKQANSVEVVIFEKPLLNITFADLLSATSNFDRGTLLAEGKFGPVYRGFLPGGIHVAVKVLVHGSTLMDQEAARELEYLGRIKHQNLVPLSGYCLAGDQRIAIYEYMENGTLQNLLHDLPLGIQTTEDWSSDTWEEDDNQGIQNVGSEGLLTTWRFRHRIALGTARALAFLHHGCSPPIIHRDVKASSVYLDYNLEPRLSDFGLAKVFGTGLDDNFGSPGYVPPEFSDPDNNCPTPKSDVYCFGVILFELLTGKKPIEDKYPDEEKDATLVSWVRRLVPNSQGSRAIDPKIRATGYEYEMVEALKIGYLCTADLPSKRPSMQQIVGLLKDIEPRSHQ